MKNTSALLLVTEGGSDTSMAREIHRDDDEVLRRTHDLYGPDNPPVITTRKVAAGPKAPTYKGTALCCYNPLLL